MTHIKLYEEWCAAGSIESSLANLNEEATGLFDVSLSEVLHFIGDVSAAVADIVVLGSGAAIDAANAIAYFIEAYISDNETDRLQFILSGIIQCAAVFLIGPLQALTVKAKAGLKKLFDYISRKTPVTAGTISDLFTTAAAVRTGLDEIIKQIASISKAIQGALAGKFKSLARWVDQKLAIRAGGNFADFIGKFFGETVPNLLTKFLKFLANLNPKRLGAGEAGAHEFNELLIKETGKVAVETSVLTKIQTRISQLLPNFNVPKVQPSQTYQRYTDENPGRRTGGGLD